MRPSSVSRTAAGCSWISLSMKSGYPPFSAASRSQPTSRPTSSTSRPDRSVMRTLPGRTSTTLSLSITKNWSARPWMAGMSEASSPVPSAWPAMSGEPRRAPTMSPGSSAWTTARANLPWTSARAARTASARPSPWCMRAATRWASTSVSVSLVTSSPPWGRVRASSR